jgi:hypothetical protein
MNTPSAQFKHPCFYVPGKYSCIDTAELRDGVWRSAIHNEDLAQIRLRYPEAEFGDFDAIHAQAEESSKSLPIEISEKDFLYGLSVLPPVGWKTARGVESFKISERLYGNVTAIYARVGERYFTFNDLITLPAEEIAERMISSAAFKRRPMKFMTLEEFRALNHTFYSPGTADKHSERDFDLLTERIQKLNKQQGPRVGDFVIMPDESIRRFTHDWTDSLQTTTRQGNDSSFYFSVNGLCDFSGSLDDALPIEQIEETTDTRHGRVWFFSNDIARAHNCVYAQVSFRVYRYQPAIEIQA